MPKLYRKISDYEWSKASVKIITSAYGFRSSGKEFWPYEAKRFLDKSDIPTNVKNMCIGYIAEISCDLSRWKLLDTFGKWDRKSERIFRKYIGDRISVDGYLNIKDGRLVPRLIRSTNQAEDILIIPSWEDSNVVHNLMKNDDFSVRSAIVILIPLRNEKVGFIFIGMPHSTSTMLDGISTLREALIKTNLIEPITLPNSYLNHVYSLLELEFKWMGESLKVYDSESSGGLDVCQHSLRVAYVGMILAHALKIRLVDRLHMFVVFLLHDSGKLDLEEKILKKLASRNWKSVDKKTELSQLTRHPEYSAARFLSLFSNIMRKNWILPILCHHSPSIHELKVQEPSVANALREMGFNNQRIYKQVITKRIKNIIKEAIEILRIADYVEDHAIERYHRFRPTRSINYNLAELFNTRNRKNFSAEILNALRNNEKCVKDIYQKDVWGFPKNAKSLRSFLENPII